MGNKYVDFVSDEHFSKCIENLHASYVKAKEKISKQKFYLNKIDIIKLTFDAKFNKIDEESIIETEIKKETAFSKRSILDQITFENYRYYLGFDKL